MKNKSHLLAIGDLTAIRNSNPTEIKLNTIYRISCPNFIEKNWDWQVLLSAHFLSISNVESLIIRCKSNLERL